MSSLRIAFRTSLRSLLGPGRFLGLFLASLVLLLFLLLPIAGSEGGLFSSRIEILRACLLFPGILVAIELRRAWPALGPEDEAQVWLHLTGTLAWPARLGALLGGLVSLHVLLAFQALLFGLGLLALPGNPEFQRASTLDALPNTEGASFLVSPGDTETFSFPASTATLRESKALLLKALWSMGPRNPIEVELLAAGADGQWWSLGHTQFHESGEVLRFPLTVNLSKARQLQIRRISPPGTLISLALGEILLLGPGLGPIHAGFRAALPYVPWALLLLLAGMTLCALLSPGLWGLAVLCLVPLIGLAPGLGQDSTGPHLGQGLSSLPASPGSSAVLLGLALLAMGLFLPRRIRQPKGEE